MTTTLVILTVLEILALVVVLAVYLMLLTRRLRSIAETLGQVAWGVGAVQTQVSSIGPALGKVNRLMRELGNDLLPGVATKAEQIASAAGAAAPAPAPASAGGGGGSGQKPWERRFGR